MTDPNFISSEPTNKSFDENVRLFDLGESNAQKETIDNLGGRPKKVCFNPYCNNRGSRWIQIIGTFEDFRENEIPHLLCDECYISLVSALDRHMVLGIASSEFSYTNHLTNLLTCHRAEYESIKGIHKRCCYHCCNSEGRRWTHVYPTILGDRDATSIGISYWVCSQCFALLGHCRRDFVALSHKIIIEEHDRRGKSISADFRKRWDQDLTSLGTEIIEENSYAIRVNDWVHLIESTVSPLKRKN